jgi:hypothetical protein
MFTPATVTLRNSVGAAGAEDCLHAYWRKPNVLQTGFQGPLCKDALLSRHQRTGAGLFHLVRQSKKQD